MAPIAAFAQEEEKTAAEYKNEGNAAVKEKKFDVALESYQKAISLWDETTIEAATVYNAADCAKKLQKYDVAIEYYNQSLALDYKADMSTYSIAEIYGKQGKVDERIALLEEAITKYTEGKVGSFIKKGLVSEYVKKANAPFKEGAAIIAECQSAKPEQYDAIKARAAEKFNEAKPWLEKALAIDPANANALAIKKSIDEAGK